MANYHLEIKNITREKDDPNSCRTKRSSISRRASYICGKKLYDNYLHQNCYNKRSDVLFRAVYMPEIAPPEYGELQTLCDEIEKAEKRKDSRTAKEFIGALPNELGIDENIRIVTDFVGNNFADHGLVAIVAIHEGHKEKDPSRNNPHAHILVSTRTLGKDGFNHKKFRELDKRQNIEIWREHWARLQNRAYERNNLDIRVSHKSLEVQGIEREPLPHIPLKEWQLEKRE